MYNFKQFVQVLSDYKCDKACPFCTAKITEWEKEDDNLQLFDSNVKTLVENNCQFKYFILSGNGEPSLYPFEDLKLIHSVIEKHNIFQIKRIQTSGILFSDCLKQNFKLFNDSNYFFEFSRLYSDFARDSKTLHYVRDYTKSDSFLSCKNLWLNYILSKDKSFEIVKKDIDDYITKFKNLKVINVKLLNPNTLNSEDIDNRYSQWILENGFTKKDSGEVLEFLIENFERLNDHDKLTDEYLFRYKNVTIIFDCKKFEKYGSTSVVNYCGKLSDYQLKNKEF